MSPSEPRVKPRWLHLLIYGKNYLSFLEYMFDRGVVSSAPGLASRGVEGEPLRDSRAGCRTDRTKPATSAYCCVTGDNKE